MLKATMSEIRICDENNRLLCKHPRSYKKFPLYITDEAHMPPEHIYYKELNAHDGAYYRRWASVYGTPMSVLIDSILKGVKHEEQAYNSCKGILHMCKNIPDHIVKEAAQICIDAKSCKYSYFKRTLAKLVNNEAETSEPGAHLPEHENIRGREYFE